MAKIAAGLFSNHAVLFIAMQVDAIVFLVDAVDRGRFSESRKELDSLLSDEALAHVSAQLLLKSC